MLKHVREQNNVELLIRFVLVKKLFFYSQGRPLSNILGIGVTQRKVEPALELLEFFLDQIMRRANVEHMLLIAQDALLNKVCERVIVPPPLRTHPLVDQF